MKKLLFLGLIFSVVLSTSVQAQTEAGGNSASMLQQAKDKIRPLMVEKTGLTEAQADKVVELNFEMRQAMAQFRDLSDADRSAKIAELKAAKQKKFAEFLTEEQIKAVNEFYQNLGKSMPPKERN